MRATRLLGALIALACSGAGPVHAVVTGSIFGPGSETLAVAVVPLESTGEGSGSQGADFARVLSRDLELSGYFRLIDPKTFVEGAGVLPESIDYVGWSAIGTQELVKGTIETAGDTVTVEVRLFDVAERRDVPEAGRRFQASRSELPRLAHRYADQLLEVLTGERGPFESKIALISTREGPLKDVYVYTFDMPAPARLTNERSITLSPNWQPDRRGVLFTSYRDHQPRLFEIDLARRAVVQFSSGDRVYLGGAWSPDGTQVLASREDGGNADIELLDRYGAVLHRLTDHWAIDVSPSWSPDGRRFAFCSSRSGSPQIYTMGISDSEPHRISDTGNYNTSPAWSPKGAHIAWATRSGNTFQIVVANADGSGARTITGAGTNEDPSWAPDGRYLVFSSSRGGRRSLWIADRDGRTQKQLTTGNGDDTQPAWSSRLD
jgi:TolB protein